MSLFEWVVVIELGVLIAQVAALASGLTAAERHREQLRRQKSSQT